jgi:hypothetical protein
MSYSIEHAGSSRGSYGDYRYRICWDGQLVAYYWHDYRGDEHGIEFPDGSKEDGPVGQMTDFIEGGGPQRLSLTARAVAYLDRKRGS